jgi:hypothetical protein
MIAIVLAGCSSVELLPPAQYVRTGPASARLIQRIVAVPATCGTLELEANKSFKPAENAFLPKTCSPEAVSGADQIIRAALSVRGHDVIDNEEVSAVTAQHVETWASEESFERTGPRFEDAPPLDRAVILAELRADAVLSARISIGASVGMSGRRVVIAQVQLLATADRALVWARRCELEVAGIMATETASIERATRCAMEAK